VAGDIRMSSQMSNHFRVSEIAGTSLFRRVGGGAIELIRAAAVSEIWCHKHLPLLDIRISKRAGL